MSIGTKVTPMCQRCVIHRATTSLMIAPGLSRVLCKPCKKVEAQELKKHVSV